MLIVLFFSKDDSVQIHRGQGCLSEILCQHAGQTTSAA